MSGYLMFPRFVPFSLLTAQLRYNARLEETNHHMCSAPDIPYSISSRKSWTGPQTLWFLLQSACSTRRVVACPLLRTVIHLKMQFPAPVHHQVSCVLGCGAHLALRDRLQSECSTRRQKAVDKVRDGQKINTTGPIVFSFIRVKM